MRQGNTESNDDFLRRFNSNLQTLQLTGGSHILCSPDTIDKVGTVATPAEISKEEEKFKAMVLLKRSDLDRYEELVMDLKRGSHVV